MKKKIIIGITDLSFHRVMGSLVAHTLNDMGFEVERVYNHHEDNFKNLKEGQIDMLASAWLPSSHGVYKENVEQIVPLISLGLHYAPYALWGVPDYIPIEMVDKIDDLLKPNVVQKMNHDIQGINAGAGITRFSIKMMEEYGLSQGGYKFHTGTEEDCFSAFERAVDNQEWIVVPLWKPQFLHYRHKIRELREVKGLLGIVDKAVLLLREDRRSLFSQDEIKQLDALCFSNEIIAELDYKICREGEDIDQVTRRWLENH